MLIVGVDPGISGAIAFMRDGDLVNVEDLPVVEVAHGKGSRKELSPQLLHDRLLDADVRIDVAVLEDVNAFGMGRTSAFRFGENVGTIKGVLAALKRRNHQGRASRQRYQNGDGDATKVEKGNGLRQGQSTVARQGDRALARQLSSLQAEDGSQPC
jgi:hypothetical protein